MKAKACISSMAVFLVVLQMVTSAPHQTSQGDSTNHRKGKNLSLLDYLQPEFAAFAAYDTDEYAPLEVDDNEISRTIPTRKPVRSRPQLATFNSPVYYIRLPPQPYMFVPGLGYVSQPPSSPVSQFVNLPVSFLSNGKPNTIYQWSGAMPSPPPPLPKPVLSQKPQTPADTPITRLPGQFTFNGKPEDIFVIRDTYNSIYSDALQNFYP